MFKIIQQGHLFAPEDRGVMDILLCGDKIARIDEDLSPLTSLLAAEVIPAAGKIVTPGFIDQHVHFLGGGDYEGPGGATTDMQFSSLVRSGITTAVGCLGSDDTARTMLDLVRRARDFERLGVTTYLYTGSFNIPSPTLTGSVRRDLITVDRVLGVKFAIAEVMASLSSVREMAEVAKDAYLGGMIAGKKGITHIHIGKKPSRMEALFELIPMTEFPLSCFLPTHVNRRTPDVMEHAIRFLKMGGTVDMSAVMDPEAGSPTSLRPDLALSEFLNAGAGIEQVTMSSDGNVSMPLFDEEGNRTGLYSAGVDLLYKAFLKILRHCGLPLTEALKVVTTNVARGLGIEEQKGSVREGKDADLILFSKDFAIEAVLARGQMMVWDGLPRVRGFFE